MSRLPRLQTFSSPDRHLPPLPPSPDAPLALCPTMSSMKRKLADEEYEALDQPRKLPAIGNQRPLAASRTVPNRQPGTKPPSVPPRLTKPDPPKLSTSVTRRPTRATSAPPKQGSTVPAGTSRSAGRVVSGSLSLKSSQTLDDKRFRDLQNQVASIESVQAANSARLAQDMEAERSKVAELQANQAALSRELAATKSQEMDQRRELVYANDEIDNIKKKHARELMDIEMQIKKREREFREIQEDLRIARSDLERERETVSSLKSTISHQSTAHLTLTTQINALQVQVSTLQSQLDLAVSTVSQGNLDLGSSQARIQELEEEARESERIRRKLHNMVQELKGNIRVFCRVRPILPSDSSLSGGFVRSTSSADSSSSRTPDDSERPSTEADAAADISYPDRRDHKEIVLCSSSSSATGQTRKELHSFGFDRVFEPSSSQAEVFEEISQLAQSCTDGYNVCIFAYGQTGSGKSFTMEGGPTETTAGMIPRAVEQVFKVAEDLKKKGWEYRMEGQFLEIAGKHEFDKKKHDIKHDKNGTRVTDVNVVPLHSPGQVRSLLALANSRRTVAATLMNERSSRSHSVFTLRISGTNQHTAEQSEGSLNLVDLAGCERLNSSGAADDKDRLKETQNINRSLSALGDVISALGEKGDKSDKHIPYRNSKLTYLLQNSLSGQSKTLMILNLSPLTAHLNESLTSLRFATKVNNTTLGTAKKQIKSTS